MLAVKALVGMGIELKCRPMLPSYVGFVLSAPVAQRIEHWPPEPGARVRVPSGAVSCN